MFENVRDWQEIEDFELQYFFLLAVHSFTLTQRICDSYDNEQETYLSNACRTREIYYPLYCPSQISSQMFQKDDILYEEIG